jgi:hypothetical protein
MAIVVKVEFIVDTFVETLMSTHGSLSSARAKASRLNDCRDTGDEDNDFEGTRMVSYVARIVS